MQDPQNWQVLGRAPGIQLRVHINYFLGSWREFDGKEIQPGRKDWRL